MLHLACRPRDCEADTNSLETEGNGTDSETDTDESGDLDGDGADKLAVITPWPDLELHVYSFGS